MRIETTNPFPTHPELTRTRIVWTPQEMAALARAADILETARVVVGPETDTGMDWGKAETIINDWIDE